MTDRHAPNRLPLVLFTLLALLLGSAACDSPGGTADTPLPTCRNGQLDPGEVCDGLIVGASSCQSAGYERGVLVCNAACTNFDYSGCAGGTGPQPDTMGGDTSAPDTSSPDTSSGDTSTGDTAAPPGAPRILSLSANTTTLEAGDTLVVTAVVTDPNGIDDLIGGQLESTSGGTYGAFATSAAEGSYTIQLTWEALNTVRGIDAAPTGSPLGLKAVFFDVGGARAEQTLTVTSRCDGTQTEGLCDGECTDLRDSWWACGSCDRNCEEVPAFSDPEIGAVCLASTCATLVEVSHERIEAGATCKTLCAEQGYSCPFAANVDATYLRGNSNSGGGDVTVELGCDERFTDGANTSLYYARCTCAAGTGVPDPDPDPDPDPTSATIVGIQSSAASVDCASTGDQAVGQSVTLEGVVVVPTFRLNTTLSAFFLSDGTREPFSGILVRFPTAQAVQFAAGDKVSVTGKHHEYFCMTQFAATAMTKVGTAAVPSARTIAKNLGPAELEPWESVIVQFDNVTVLSHTEFGDADTNAGVLIDDMIMGNTFVLPAVGTIYPRIRGALTFGFDAFRIQPRSAADLPQ